MSYICGYTDIFLTTYVLGFWKYMDLAFRKQDTCILLYRNYSGIRVLVYAVAPFQGILFSLFIAPVLFSLFSTSRELFSFKT